jgi:hypothetical protein
MGSPVQAFEKTVHFIRVALLESTWSGDDDLLEMGGQDAGHTVRSFTGNGTEDENPLFFEEDFKGFHHLLNRKGGMGTIEDERGLSIQYLHASRQENSIEP